uniref:Portal protein n=1 Tax=Siphoviridae sp. ctYM922 TaxID=2825547 RepID=A0A8S5U938_9CAUD|nr:MAG TPA: portal protein [Siphoviridae sp. ctYM922]
MNILDKIKSVFNNKNIKNEDEEIGDPLLTALLRDEPITREKALMIPAISSNVDYIGNMIASIPIKLYRKKNDKVEEVKDDIRVFLLNNDTGDTLDAFQMKKAMIEDYLLGKGGYCYIKKDLNKIEGLFYVEDRKVSIYKNTDPINKDIVFRIGSKSYFNHELIKLLRNTKNGGYGIGITEELEKVIETSFSTLVYQLGLVKSGGNKKGFLKSLKKLGDAEMNALKKAWRDLYTNNKENIVILNNGLEFQESSNSSVEMQLNESKKTFQEEIDRIFHIHQNDTNLTFKEAIFTILKAFATQLNSVMLLEKEKKEYYFDFDTKEILKSNTLDRYKAQNEAIKGGWKTINEVRLEENLNTIEGMDVLNIGLGSSLYDVKTNSYYTPNTNQISKLEENNNKIEQNGGD